MGFITVYKITIMWTGTFNFLMHMEGKIQVPKDVRVSFDWNYVLYDIQDKKLL